jgi:carboxyl-terminal processing protease
MNNKIYKGIIIFLLGFILAFFLADNIKNSDIYKKYFKKELKKEKLNFDFLNEVEEKIEEKFVDTREDKTKEITADDKIFGAAEGLTASYGDPHTMFFPPEDGKMFSDDISGEFSGVGMEITNRNGFLTVVSPLPDSPAKKAGIKPKDIISKIDNIDSLSMSSNTAVKLIRGKVGEEVVLEVLRKGEPEPLKIKIKRALIKIPVVKTFVKDNVFVIKLFSFTENSPKLFFSKIIKDFKKSKTDKMIIDLRGNSGGLLSAAVFISGLFLEEGKIIVTEDYEGKKDNKIWKSGDIHLSPDKTTNIFRNLKLGILVDAGSASASEILAGSLSDNGKAILFGENTFGKGTVQELINFDNGSSLKVTVAKFILPDGEWISYKGIRPDVEIKNEIEELKKIKESGSYSDYIDTQLKETIKYISEIKNQKDFEKKIQDFKKERKEKNKLLREEERAKKILESK